jgi:hypothetical protein
VRNATWRRWPNQEVVTVQGSHLLQEDAPEDVGKATDGALHREASGLASRAADVTRSGGQQERRR